MLYGQVTDHTEPVLQRRMMIVTDDYIVVLDYLRGEEQHMYDCLYHVKGFRGLDGERIAWQRHTAQFDPSPLSSGQFITNCDWYQVSAPVKAVFEMAYGLDADNRGTLMRHSEDGVLRMDVHALYPQKAEVMVGTVPENHNVHRNLRWAVKGDGKLLASGGFGAWILGKDTIDVPVEGVDCLELVVNVDTFDTDFREQKIQIPKAVFWGDPYILTTDSSRVYLQELALERENSDPGTGNGSDYYGGPVRIAGDLYEKAVPANPVDYEKDGVLRVSLKGLKSVKFVSAIGGDYPLGDESWRRKTLAIRTSGQEARFITIVEPYEQERMITHAEALDAHTVKVELSDGRTQIMEISNLDKGQDIGVRITESEKETVVREENAR